MRGHLASLPYFLGLTQPGTHPIHSPSFPLPSSSPHLIPSSHIPISFFSTFLGSSPQSQPSSSWLLFRALQNHSPSFPQSLMGSLPSIKTLLPPSCKTLEQESSEGFQQRSPAQPSPAIHWLVITGAGKGRLARVSGKDDWPNNDWFPYLNALLIFIPPPKPSPQASVGLRTHKMADQS